MLCFFESLHVTTYLGKLYSNYKSSLVYFDPQQVSYPGYTLEGSLEKIRTPGSSTDYRRYLTTSEEADFRAQWQTIANITTYFRCAEIAYGRSEYNVSSYSFCFVIRVNSKLSADEIFGRILWPGGVTIFMIGDSELIWE